MRTFLQSLLVPALLLAGTGDVRERLEGYQERLLSSSFRVEYQARGGEVMEGKEVSSHKSKRVLVRNGRDFYEHTFMELPDSFLDLEIFFIDESTYLCQRRVCQKDSAIDPEKMVRASSQSLILVDMEREGVSVVATESEHGIYKGRDCEFFRIVLEDSGKKTEYELRVDKETGAPLWYTNISRDATNSFIFGEESIEFSQGAQEVKIPEGYEIKEGGKIELKFMIKPDGKR